MTAKKKKRKAAKKPVRRRACPVTAPELVFPPGSASERAKDEVMIFAPGSFPSARPRDPRTFWQRVRDFFQGKP